MGVCWNMVLEYGDAPPQHEYHMLGNGLGSGFSAI